MGYKNNKKIKFISKNKVSSLEIHKKLPNHITVSKDIHFKIIKYLSFVETQRLLSFVYGKESRHYDFFLRQIADYYNPIDCLIHINNFFITYAGNFTLICFLEAYFKGTPNYAFAKFNLDEFIEKDIVTLKREELGFLTYKICYENSPNDKSAYDMFQNQFIGKNIMRGALLNKKNSLHYKYNEIRRNNVITSILN